MFKINNNRIYLTKGDTAYLEVELWNKDSKYVPEEGDKLALSVKKSLADKDYELRIEAKANTVINIIPEDTKEMEPGNYFYDIQLTTVLGEVFTVIPPSAFYLGEEVNYD